MLSQDPSASKGKAMAVVYGAAINLSLHAKMDKILEALPDFTGVKEMHNDLKTRLDSTFALTPDQTVSADPFFLPP